MIINNENELIEQIKFKTKNEIKEIFSNTNLKPEPLNHFQQTLLYLVGINASFDLINFILMQQQQQQQQQPVIDNTESLFVSIENSNFNVATLLLNHGTPIDGKNSKSENIVEYLVGKHKLDFKRLSFILGCKNDASLITSKVLCRLIELKDLALIKEIFNTSYYSLSLIVDLLLLYKKRTPFSNEALQKLLVTSRQAITAINEKTKTGHYPLLEAVSTNDIKMVKVLVDYAEEKNLRLTTQNKLMLNVFQQNPMEMEIAQLLMDYANKNNILLDVNEKDSLGAYPLFYAVHSGEVERAQLLMAYANTNNILLNINDKISNGNYPLLWATRKNDTRMVRLLIDYANYHHIVLAVNEKNDDKDYPLLWATQKNNTTVVQWIMDYAMENAILLSMNDVENDGFYPFLLATKNDNMEMVRRFIDYADKNKLVLSINECNINGDYPLLHAAKNNNEDMLRLIVDYAKRNKIPLKLEDKMVKEKINRIQSSCSIS